MHLMCELAKCVSRVGTYGDDDEVFPHCPRSQAMDEDVTTLHVTVSSAVRIHSTNVIPVHSRMSSVQRLVPVSYTHLTLPTILRV